MKISKELELAIRAAKEAGNFLKQREDIHVDALEGKDIKLSSDKMSEKIIMDILQESEISILSEEFGFKDEKSKFCWIIDPLDGTINYYRGMDEMACVSIALWKEDRPILGVVYRFMCDELFYGEIVSIRGMEDKNMLTFYLGSDNSDLKIKLTNMANYNSLIYALISNHNIEVNENINRKLKKEGEN